MQEAVIREIQQLRLLMGSARDPRGRVFAQLADALRRNGELEEAWELVRRGVDEDPHFVPGHLVKGWVLQDRGELDEALAAYRRAVDLDPENPFGLYGVGALLRARGDESGAELLDRARELHPAVEDTAPVAPEPLVPLHELPFLPLAELAPDGVTAPAPTAPVHTAGPDEAGAEVEADLPFMSLAELAPDDAPAGDVAVEAADAGQVDADLPFMSLAELAPDGPEAGEGTPDPEPVVVDEVRAHEALAGEADIPDDGEDAPAVEPVAEAAEAAEPVADEEAPIEMEPLADEEAPVHMEPVAEAAEAGQADVDAGPATDPEDADATPATRTMAELLVSQNQVGRAVAIYEEILARDPDNRDIADRIQELQDELHPELSGAAEPVESGPSPFTWHEDDAGEDDGDPSTSRAGEEGADDPGAAGGGTAAAYFGDLLSFSPRRDGGRTGPGALAEGDHEGGAETGGEDAAGTDR